MRACRTGMDSSPPVQMNAQAMIEQREQIK